MTNSKSMLSLVVNNAIAKGSPVIAERRAVEAADVGTPVVRTLQGCQTLRGFIYAKHNSGGGYAITGAGMVATGSRFDIVWDNKTTSINISDAIAKPWIESPYCEGVEIASSERLANMVSEAEEKQARQRDERQAERDAAAITRAEFIETIRPMIPSLSLIHI